jgi:hypothetical protein
MYKNSLKVFDVGMTCIDITIQEVYKVSSFLGTLIILRMVFYLIKLL